MTQQATGSGAGAGSGSGGASGSGAAGAGADKGAAAAGAGNTGNGAAAAAASAAAAAAAGTGGGAAAAGAGDKGAGAADGKGTDAGKGAAAGADGKGADAGANWDAKWRETYAGQDETKLNVLKRYDSPRAVLDALFAARQRIDSGEVKTALPKDATPEQITAWRKDHGIPEKPDGYLEKLPADLKLEDSDKQVLAPYLETLHKHNVDPATAAELIQVRAQALDKMVETRVQEDEKLRVATEDQLRAEWGNDYRANINNIHSMLKGAPPEVAEAFLDARTPDGKPLFGTKEAVQWFAQLARTINPFGTLVGGDGGALDQKGVDARITEIEVLMGKQDSEYWKGPRADKMQAEYRDLIDRRDLMRKRAAA